MVDTAVEGRRKILGIRDARSPLDPCSRGLQRCHLIMMLVTHTLSIMVNKWTVAFVCFRKYMHTAQICFDFFLTYILYDMFWLCDRCVVDCRTCRTDSGIPCGHIENSALGNSKKTCFMVRLTLWFVFCDFFKNFFLAVLNVHACHDQTRMHFQPPRNEMKRIIFQGGKRQNHKCLWSGPFLIEFP